MDSDQIGLKYLILEPELDQSVSLAKIIKNNIPNVYIYGGYIRRLKKISYFINRSPYFDSYIEVDFSDEVFLKGFDRIIPTGADSTENMVKLSGLLKIGDSCFSSKNLVVNDKKRMLKIVNSLNIPCPETFFSADKINFFPVFYKVAYDNINPKPCGVIKNKSSLKRLNKKNIIFQEFIPGSSTFGLAFLADNGELICKTAHEEKLSFPYKGGSAVLLQRIESERLLELTRKIIKKIGYTGWGLAEYKYCKKRNDFVFMEINSKIWASFEFALVNEPEFANRLFNISLNKEPSKSAVYTHRLLGLFCFQYFKFLPKIIKAEKITISTKKNLYYYFRKFIPF